MRKLDNYECSRIYGCGIGLGEAIEGAIEGIVSAAHGSEGALALAEALGAFEDPETKVPKYTTDEYILNMDANIANTYMSDLIHHTGSDKITDTQRENAIINLQHDGRVFFNPKDNKFHPLGGEPSNGAYTKSDIDNPDTKRELEYILEKTLTDLRSQNPDVEKGAIEALKNGTKECAFHYDVKQNKFVIG
ncbi:TPA: hypothetical protein M2Q89_004847 [Escherichia coli]|nr:hypothetical protein [Escherichia coli]